MTTSLFKQKVPQIARGNMATSKLLRKKSLRYITSNGKKQAVILDMDQLQEIERKLEDLEDALTYEKAKRQATGFITLENFRKELKAVGKL